ncbi:MAG: Rieske 2Fe-2S domain-containing protein [Bacteroidota bacterium]
MEQNRRVFIRKLAVGLTGIGLSPLVWQCTTDSLEDFQPSPADEMLTLSGPNDLALLISEQQVDIRWVSEAVNFLKIEFSANGGNEWTSVVESINADLGTYAWTLPKTNSKNCYFRLTNLTTGLQIQNDEPFTVGQAKVISLDRLSEIQDIGSEAILERGGLQVARYRKLAENKYEVLDLSCTHFGCTVQWLESLSEFHCPCHGAVFTESGCVVKGPTKEPLWKLLNFTDTESNSLVVYQFLLEEGGC